MTHSFNQNETEHIRKMARELNVSVNSYLISLILSVRKDLNVVGIPIDIREDDKSMSNQVAGIAINFKYVKKKKLKEKAKVIHTRIQKILKSPTQKYFVLLFMSQLCPTLIDAVLLAAHGQSNNKLAEKVACTLGYKGIKKRDLGVSNLGIIDIQTDYGQYKVNNVIFIPPAITYTQNIIGVSTINDRITITYHGMKKDEEESWFDELVYMLNRDKYINQ